KTKLATRRFNGSSQKKRGFSIIARSAKRSFRLRPGARLGPLSMRERRWIFFGPKDRMKSISSFSLKFFRMRILQLHPREPEPNRSESIRFVQPTDFSSRRLRLPRKQRTKATRPAKSRNQFKKLSSKKRKAPVRGEPNGRLKVLPVKGLSVV